MYSIKIFKQHNTTTAEVQMYIKVLAKISHFLAPV